MFMIEKFGKVISEKGKEAVDKARILAEIAGLKSQIATCEEVVRKNYRDLGKLYYERHCGIWENEEPDGQDREVLYEKQIRAITNAKKAIEDLQGKIEVLKNLT